MIEQLAFEADLVRADARGEGEPEVAASQIARNELQLQQRLAQAALADARVPLLDRLDVVESTADARDEREVRRGAVDYLLGAERQPRAGELAREQREVPGVGVRRRQRLQRRDSLLGRPFASTLVPTTSRATARSSSSSRESSTSSG